jgi:membrane associated rhomboid family serine protease
MMYRVTRLLDHAADFLSAGPLRGPVLGMGTGATGAVPWVASMSHANALLQVILTSVSIIAACVGLIVGVYTLRKLVREEAERKARIKADWKACMDRLDQGD